MRFILKFMALLALIMGGKLNKSSQRAALASHLKSSPAVEVVSVGSRTSTPSPAGNFQQPEAPRSQVLSVFFK